MKKGMTIWMCFISAIVLISWVGMVSIAQAKTLKYSSPYGETNPMTSSMQWFGKELEKRTNGEYKAKFFFSGTMGKAPDMPEMCKNRAVDFIFTGMGYTPHIFKLNRGFELMYITENPHANGAALWDLYHNYKPIRDEWENNGLMMVFPAGIDIMACQGRKATRSVDDLKGQKLRSYAGVAEMIKLWDGNPIALSYAEIYDALNRGVLDGAFGIPSLNVYASRFWEVAPHLYNTGAGIYACTYFAMSKKTYDSFPENVKKVVEDLRIEGMARHREWMAQTEKEVFEKLKQEKTIQIINWSPEEKAKGKKLAVPGIWQAWLDEMEKGGLPGKEFIEKYRNLVQKYEKKYPYQNPYDF